MKSPFKVIAASGLLAGLFLAGQATSKTMLDLTTVACGQTLTQSVKVANDLTNCPDNGLVVGRDGITIDLNGHTVDGQSLIKPGTGGIANEGHSGVTVENGTITDFYFAAVYVGPRNVVRNLTVRKIGSGCKQGDICAGIFLFHAAKATVIGNHVSSTTARVQVNGIDVYASPGVRVERNRVSRNAGDGMSVFQSQGARIVGNRVDGNRDIGIQVNEGSDSVLVMSNRVSGNRNTGIAVGASRRARVLDNTITGSSEVGLLLFNLPGGLIRGNHAFGNWDGIGLYGGQVGVAGLGGPQQGSRGNRLVGNSATHNRHGGIWIKGDSHKFSVDRNLISGNVASVNGRAGGLVLDGNVRDNKLRGNKANSNAGRGIDARHGAIDAGGNRARGNRRKPQCLGVRCA